MQLISQIQQTFPVIFYGIFLAGVCLIACKMQDNGPFFCEQKQIRWILAGFIVPLLYFLVKSLLSLFVPGYIINSLSDKYAQFNVLMLPLLILLEVLQPAHLYTRPLRFIHAFIMLIVLLAGILTNRNFLKSLLPVLVLSILFDSLWLFKDKLVVKHFTLVPPDLFRLFVLLSLAVAVAAMVSLQYRLTAVYCLCVIGTVVLYAAYFIPLIIKNLSKPMLVIDSSGRKLLREEVPPYGKKQDVLGKRQQARFKELYNRLLKIMEERRPYIDAELTVQELASLLGTNKTYMSAILKREGRKNFNYFINAYRIRDAQRIFRQKPRVKVSELSRMVGFKSVSAFTEAFKRHQGGTPGDWCKHMKQTSENYENNKEQN